MITRIEATHYRCVKKLDVDLGQFRVVVGANGAGKTALLDIPILLGDLLRERMPSTAFTRSQHGKAPRTSPLRELVYQGSVDSFVLAIEARLPERVTQELLEGATVAVRKNKHRWPTHLRYELCFKIPQWRQLHVQNEILFTFNDLTAPQRQTVEQAAPRLQGELVPYRNRRFIIEREYGGEPRYRVETEAQAKPRSASIQAMQLALAKIEFESAKEFPAARWLRDTLVEETTYFDPNRELLRQASVPGHPLKLLPDGRNTPWLALDLKKTAPDRFIRWKDYVHIALPQITDIDVREREEDHHAYFVVTYNNSYKVTSFGLSDGTLRILALTLLSYLERAPQIVVVEEPERGIHPRSVEIVLQGLRAMYDSQVLVSSHSPLVLAHTDLEHLVAAQLRSDGAVELVAGPAHPRMVDMDGAIDLETLFAAGVLG